MTENRFRIEPQPENSRYALLDSDRAEGDQMIGQVEYLDVVEGETTQRIMFHTSVNEEYGGQGLASRIVKAAFDHAANEGLVIVPVCPYIKAWVPKHPEYDANVVTATKQHIQSVIESQKK